MPPRRARVLVVDDSFVIRKLVARLLGAEVGIEVVGMAAEGREALAQIEKLQPDLVTLDVEMPGMNGIETVVEIRKRWPKLPVIMLSSQTTAGAKITLHALERGATDYVTRPMNLGAQAAHAHLRDSLVPKIRALCPVNTLPAPARPFVPLPVVPVAPMAPARVELVVIGASTGGPQALTTVISSLPANLPVPVVIVQHMPPLFTKLFADQLNAKCAIAVEEARAHVPLAPGKVWIAQGDKHLAVRGSRHSPTIEPIDGPMENYVRPAVDVLFRTAAAVVGPGVLAAVLTGMGADGAKGAVAVRAAGGFVIAQDQPSSVIWGMPGAVVNAGAADRVLPLDQIGQELTVRANGAVRRTSKVSVFM